MRLRVVSFNVRTGLAQDGRHCWWRRRSAALAVLERLAPDVVGLQEAMGFQRRWLFDRLDGLDPHGEGRGHRGGEQCTIGVRRDAVGVLATRTRWYGEDPDRRGQRLPGAQLPRIATTCELRTVDGDELWITNTHLDHRRAELRRRSIDQLLDWIEGQRPHVLCGDLNARPEDPLFSALRERGFEHAVEPTGPGSFHGFRGGTDGPRIDHILVTGGLDVTTGFVDHGDRDGPFESDHWPLVADVELGCSQHE